MAKKYKCPYCNDRLIRKELIDHIDEEHEELIPDGFESAQVVYDLVNGTKGAGRCRVCSGPTKWNSSSKRYDTLCINPKCKQKMREDYQKNMLRVHGTYNILTSDEQQKKMLANRSISGKYKFTDGGVVTYTGSYEKKFLEFADKVMQIPSKDIMAPGPTLEYEMNGEKHFYITDFLYIPYNLIIEVKDGGNNPNRKDTDGMRSSRQRTIEKEKLITDRGEYNYLRLTDNQFVQLLEIFMDIKKALIEGDDSKVVRINESYLEVDDEPHIFTSGDFDQYKEYGEQRLKEIEESNKNIIPEFKSDKELFNFMRKNISYKNYTKLMSPEEVYNSKKGSCHDQVIFELYCLRKLNLHPKALFLIEYNPNGNGNTNMTHSLVYYEKNGKICWFENAWGGNEGIHEFNSISELKEELYKLHKDGKFGNIKQYPELEITSFKSHKSGESLQELVDICVNESYLEESCKDLNAARRLCNDIRKIAKKYDANFFFVTDGASAYSNGNGTSNPAVKSMRNAMDDWEKKNGFNPDDDWSHNINDTSNYRLKESKIEQDLTKFKSYHLEPLIKAKNKRKLGGWDEELYSKSIEDAIINDIKYKYECKRYTQVPAAVYTAGRDLKAVYLGTITIFDKDNPNNWEWIEQEYLDEKTYNYLKNNPIAEATDIDNFYDEEYYD